MLVDDVKQWVGKVLDSENDVNLMIVRGVIAPWGKAPAIQAFNSKRGLVVRGNVQVERRYNRDGKTYVVPTMVQFVAFGDVAGSLQDAEEGDEVLLVGRWNQRQYKAKDGSKRWAHELVVIMGGYL